MNLKRVEELELRSTLSLKMGMNIREVAQFFHKHKIGAAPVLDQDGKLTGVFTERDLLFKVVSPSKDPDQVLIDEVMTKDIVTVRPDQSLQDAYILMNDIRCRHLPVVDASGTLLSFISIRDVMQSIMQEVVDQFMAA